MHANSCRFLLPFFRLGLLSRWATQPPFEVSPAEIPSDPTDQRLPQVGLSRFSDQRAPAATLNRTGLAGKRPSAK
jgi:hypothetical protein